MDYKNHPEVPPGCTLLKTDEHGVWIYGIAMEIGMNYRPIIASIARCGWVDERKRLDGLSGGYDDECLMRAWARFETHDQEEEWRLWGLKDE